MSYLESIIQRAKTIKYELPGNPETDRYALGVSGGADSSALAIVMKTLFPDVPFLFVFTDTHAEGDALYANLDELESFLDIEIIRISHDKGLWGLIESYGGFLPSQRARYCTRDLKIIPYQNWVKSILTGNETLHSFVGIRADEATRNGLVTSDAQLISHFPFQQLGIHRADVFGLLQETVGVPGIYATRSRSGCQICPMMRKTEFLATLRREERAFLKAMGYEKLCAEDVERYRDLTIPITKETKLASNHLTLPFPKRADLRFADTTRPVVWPKQKRKPKKRDTNDANSANDANDANEVKSVLWVGAELFVHPGVGDHGVWWQEMVAISTTRNGLMTQMKNHYKHRMGTPEASGLDAEAMRDELRLVAYMVELPENSISLAKPSKKSYTWQAGQALSQLKQYNSAVMRTLQVAGMDQEIDEYQGFPELTWQQERREGLLKAKAKINKPYGRVIEMDLVEFDLEQQPASKKEQPRKPEQTVFSFAA